MYAKNPKLSFEKDKKDHSFKISAKTIRARKIPPQNIIRRLRDRQSYGTNLKIFYTNIFPNFTVSGVDKPPCYLRKFTPDGRHLIAFSSDLNSLEIYFFKGSQAGQHLLEKTTGDYITRGTNNVSKHITSNIFNNFFTLLHTTKLTTQAVLNRECSLFTDDSRFVIVASAIPEGRHPTHREMYHCNECLAPNINLVLEDYSIHVVEVATGFLYDTLHFKCDKIFLSHNQGLYLYRRTLAVLSVQHQTIHIYQLTEEGKLLKCRSIGRFCFEDDEHLVNMVVSKPLKTAFQESLPDCSFPPNTQFTSSSSAHQPLLNYLSLPNKSEWGRNEKVICSLKHKLLVFLYKKVSAESEVTGDKKYLVNFLRHFDFFLNLKMWRMQLLDENHLLIRYSTEAVVTMRSTDLNIQPSFFTVYDIKEACFTCFYENTSSELVSLFEDYSDLFRNSEQPHNPPSHHNRFRFKHGLSASKPGNKSDEIKRVLAQLPICAQSYSPSPYLDYSNYCYDNKWVSALERPKTAGDHAIRFFSSECGLFKFKLFTGLAGVKLPHYHLSNRRLVAFIFHPFEPFAISVQRTNTEYLCNFHVRNSYCISPPLNIPPNGYSFINRFSFNNGNVVGLNNERYRGVRGEGSVSNNDISIVNDDTNNNNRDYVINNNNASRNNQSRQSAGTSSPNESLTLSHSDSQNTLSESTQDNDEEDEDDEEEEDDNDN